MNSVVTTMSHAAFVLLTLEADQGNGQIPIRHKVLRLPFTDYLVLVSLPDLVHPASHTLPQPGLSSEGPFVVSEDSLPSGTEHPV